MPERLSVVILAKNAESHFERCLQSVKWADEIVVVDGHSTDKTCDIARAYGATVYLKTFEGFPAERQFAIDHTTHDWVLSLDTDMIVPPELAAEIQQLLVDGPRRDAYLMRCLNHFVGREIRHCSWFDHRFLRLFNKRTGAYDLSMKVLDHFQCRGSIGRLRGHLIHHQTESLEEYLQKMMRLFAPLTAHEYQVMGVRIAWWNMPWYFVMRPFLTFIHKYIWKLGILDGTAGFVISLNSAILYYAIFIILWDRQRGVPQYDFNRYLPNAATTARKSHGAGR